MGHVQFGAVGVLVGTVAVAVSVQAQRPASLRDFSTTLQLEEVADPSASISIGDLNGDGRLDIVLGKGRHFPLVDRVLLNNGAGAFITADLGTVADRTYSAVLADVEGDGDLDVIVSNDRPDAKLVYVNDGRGQFRVLGTWGNPAWSTRYISVADLNGDRRPDIIAANRPGPSAACLNDGGGQFSRCVDLPVPSATIIVPADFDGDGAIDLAVPRRDGGQSMIYFNDGRAGFPRTSPFGFATTAARAAAAGDLNGDGRPDLVVGDELAGSFVYLNEGRGRLGSPLQLKFDAVLTPYSVAIADLNRDKRADIVIGYVNGRGSVLFNDGSGRRFSQVRFGDGRGSFYGLAIGKVDDDDFPDIAVARSDAPNVVYLSRADDVVSTSDVIESPVPFFEAMGRDPENPAVGVWRGPVDDESYGVEIRIERLVPALVTGQILYYTKDSNIVNGVSRHMLVDKTSAGVYVFREMVEAGDIEPGWIHARLIDGDRLRLEWYAARDGKGASLGTATLGRKVGR